MMRAAQPLNAHRMLVCAPLAFLLSSRTHALNDPVLPLFLLRLRGCASTNRHKGDHAPSYKALAQAFQWDHSKHELVGDRDTQPPPPLFPCRCSCAL